MKKLLLLAIVVLGISAVSFGQAKSATATANATLVTAINISKTGTDLNFGNIVAGVAGTVKVDKNGTRTSDNPVLVPQAGWSAAVFTVTGSAGYLYTVTLPSSATTVTTTSTATGTKSMSVSGWEHSATGTLDSEGKEELKVGGILTVAGDQVAGVYTSATPFTVTVNYN